MKRDFTHCTADFIITNVAVSYIHTLHEQYNNIELLTFHMARRLVSCVLHMGFSFVLRTYTSLTSAPTHSTEVSWRLSPVELGTATTPEWVGVTCLL